MSQSTATMYAGEIYGPCQVRLVEVERAGLDRKANEPQILFQPELACLCGSDLTYFEGGYPEYTPKVGQSLHEMIGRVLETNGTRFRPGDRVLCVPVDHFGFYQQYSVSERRAIPLDPRPADHHALMAQPLGTVIFALKKPQPVLDRQVVVVGQGPMGLLFTRVLRNLGARRIITIDQVAARLELSRALGATDVIDSRQSDPVQAVRELTGGGADLVVEAVGHREQVLNLCVDLCRYRGEILFFGVPPETIDGIRFKDLFWKNLTIFTSVGPDFERDFPLAMQWIAERRLDVEPLVTHRFPVTEVQRAFDLFHQRQDGAVKVLLEMT